ncbi:MAG: phospholipase D-like domain-containing protein [Gaiellaceae bacterium]
MIQVRTLTDGGQPPLEIARLLASFLERAERTLDIAIYDVNLNDETEEIVLGTLRSAAERGVRVRLLYNLDRRPPGAVAPPPPKTRYEEIEALPIATCAVPGWPDLMHHKYIVRDAASVWTGSTNWTDDSWSREENVIAVVDAPPIAALYAEDFEQLWQTKRVRRSGKVSTAASDGVRAWFTPKRAEKLTHRIADAIDRAERRVRIASPVISSGLILGALAEVAADGDVDLAGVVDATQVQQVLAQWAENPIQTWKAPALRTALTAAAFTGKRSTPYAPGSVHDYMHAKVTVCDDTVFVGSFNLSHSGETNAENVLEIADKAIADQMATFIDEVRVRYPPVELAVRVRVRKPRRWRFRRKRQ